MIFIAWMVALAASWPAHGQNIAPRSSGTLIKKRTTSGETASPMNTMPASASAAIKPRGARRPAQVSAIPTSPAMDISTSPEGIPPLLENPSASGLNPASKLDASVLRIGGGFVFKKLTILDTSDQFNSTFNASLPGMYLEAWYRTPSQMIFGGQLAFSSLKFDEQRALRVGGEFSFTRPVNLHEGFKLNLLPEVNLGFSTGSHYIFTEETVYNEYSLKRFSLGTGLRLEKRFGTLFESSVGIFVVQDLMLKSSLGGPYDAQWTARNINYTFSLSLINFKKFRINLGFVKMTEGFRVVKDDEPIEHVEKGSVINCGVLYTY